MTQRGKIRRSILASLRSGRNKQKKKGEPVSVIGKRLSERFMVAGKYLINIGEVVIRR